ncbi:glycerol-3-phosphate dehydrogenase/oxidase [Hymenobacter busanensis]|uniref:Glycerol-3-phosphate dehydrogenase/oxidase n=2 Tax=Hymenobacter busanensis TaxID=2607656 RepID=A0A7L5A4D0_9BACT|nr:glycerol-3-phosphate dehydrogenase/oxidase [Hymenobacter busanensis]KAA9332487.1 glycerol-3-phosphate dehydrogenase/oxidase [Hymenobacter busanensis]QHJ09662.1 FAD-dependent oxidoreductase [Hymenobacter busanensis]
MPLPREIQLARLAAEPEWDIIVIGGGATGLGAALDSASRGYRTLLVEQHDFAKGTSSRSTKLVHGGVRYLAQGQIRLVREALHEREVLRQNAPHLVHSQAFVIPAYRWGAVPFYTLGLKLYDLLAGRHSFGASQALSAAETLQRLPTVRPTGLRGGVLYQDGQFDDARLAINLAQTCIEQGATVLNYCAVRGLLKTPAGRVCGVQAEDVETGMVYEVRARAVINATGIFVDAIRRLDAPAAAPLVRASQGVHLVLDRAFLPGADALMIPQTEDGRVLFAVPWHNHVVLGTTDTPVAHITAEPRALEAEIDFILGTAAQYLLRPPQRADVRSVFAGLRPLAAQSGKAATKELSRGHKIEVSAAGLITITGGKWTTYRRMGEDAVDRAAAVGGLPHQPSPTVRLPIHGAQAASAQAGSHLAVYGADVAALLELVAQQPALGEQLHPRLPYLKAEVVWAARYELARTVEDVLARRLRALFLDAQAALEMAPAVAALLAQELRRDEQWQKTQLASFAEQARGYLLI